MNKPVNTFLGALIAAIIMFTAGLLASFQQGDVQSLSEIKEATWVILIGSAFLSFLKDFHAVWSRRQINRLTKSGDGGI